MRRLLVLLLLTALAPGIAGCGDGENLADEITERVTQARDDVRERTQRVRERIERVRADAEQVGREVRERVREVLAELEQVVPEAGPTTRAPSAAGRAATNEIDAFMTDVIEDVDRYWVATFAANDLPEPRVNYVWVPPGRLARSSCGAAADDRAAFYCPADDTIYVGQRLAAELFAGIAEGFPGQDAGYGRAVGDFGVAYIVAHEYAHNLQHELGFFSSGRARGQGVKPFELQADCMAGLWGNSVFRAGRIKEGDVEEAMSTALAVGDFGFESEQHHGTPEERRDAWLIGYETGDPATCRHFVGA